MAGTHDECVVYQAVLCIHSVSEVFTVTRSDSHSNGNVCNGNSYVISQNANLFYFLNVWRLVIFFNLLFQKKLAFVCCSPRKKHNNMSVGKVISLCDKQPLLLEISKGKHAAATQVLSEFLLSPHSPRCPHASLNSCVVALEGPLILWYSDQ